MNDKSKTPMRLGSIAAYARQGGRAHYVTERPPEPAKPRSEWTEIDRLRACLRSISDGYLVNHTSKWVKATVDGALKDV